MAIPFGDNLVYQGREPNFTRDQFKTIEEMKNFPPNYLPDVFIATCVEDGNVYVFNRNNEEDATLGQWRLLSGGAAGELSEEVISAFSVGGVQEGVTFPIGTSIEEIIKKILVGKQFVEDDFYYGTSATQEVVSLYQFSGSTSSACTVVANNEYVVFAAKQKFGEFNIQDNNGFTYNSDFNKTTLTHNGEIYNVYIGKYKITSPNGFEYKLTFK